jgi:DNA-3-methyladenine glycosylase II
MRTGWQCDGALRWCSGCALQYKFGSIPEEALRLLISNAEVIVKKRKATAPPSITLLQTETDIRAGLKALRRTCPHLRKAHDRTGDPALRRRPGGFEGLVRIINGQQLSVASAGAIHTRLTATLQPLTAAAILTASDDTLRGCGLSRPKVKTVRALAQAVQGGLDLEALGSLAVADAHALLTAVSGIGPWTADVYLMFCVGHADVFAPGDLALQIAAQDVMGLPARPTAKEMATIAERWQPWRAIAALVLWAYYAEMKANGTALPA